MELKLYKVVSETHGERYVVATNMGNAESHVPFYPDRIEFIGDVEISDSATERIVEAVSK